MSVEDFLKRLAMPLVKDELMLIIQMIPKKIILGISHVDAKHIQFMPVRSQE